MLKIKVENCLKRAVRTHLKSSLHSPVSIEVFSSDNEKFGHYSTNAALKLASIKRKNPLKTAADIVDALTNKAPSGFFEKIEIAKPGFINFWLSPKIIAEGFKEISKTGFKPQSKRKKKTVIVDYSSPNVAKPMHVGHLRSTIIGDALANIYEFLGYKVVRWNYIGDWGTQFGKLIAAYKLWGKKSDVEQSAIETLLKLYVRFHHEESQKTELRSFGQEEFSKLEQGDGENRRLWLYFRRESLKEFNRIYGRLQIKFDVIQGESFYEKDLKNLIEKIKRKGLTKESMGALVVPLEKFSLPPALIRKSDEASLYLTRDIANFEYRVKKYNPQKIIVVVGNEQSLHFEQLKAVLKLLGFDSEKLLHIKFGLVLGEKGKKLSTRKGEVIKLEELMDKSVRMARKIVEQKNPKILHKQKIAEAVGLGSIKYNDLSQNRQSDIIFDWDKMLNLYGNSSAYLQYTYARLKSILRKGRVQKFDPSFLTEEAELRLILKLDEFEDTILSASESYLPSKIADYLYDLAKSVNNFYERYPVLKAGKGKCQARLALIKSTSEALKSGLKILGIKTLERM